MRTLYGRTELKCALLAIIATITACGQTLVNMGTQARNIDFSGAPFTRPVKIGSGVPASCFVGELFFDIGAIAGQNLYGCTAVNTWTLLGGNLQTSGSGPFSLTGQVSVSTPPTPSAGTGTLYFSAAGSVTYEDASGNLYAMPNAAILNAPANGFWAGPTFGSNAAPTYRAITYPDFPVLTSGHFIVGNASVATDTAMTGDCTLSSTGAISCTNILGSRIGTAIASAATIAPVSPIVHVTGTTTITTITAPSTCKTAGTGCILRIIPDGLWSTGTGGNIAIASTAVVSKILTMVYDPAILKWYPSY